MEEPVFMDLSIIIPVFEESKKIVRDITTASAFLKAHHLTGEIIVVDDGSQDDTAAVVECVETAGDISLQVIRYQPHRGKGYALRTGMKASGGRYVMFADSGCCVPYENAARALHLLRSGACDIAQGSRNLPESQILKPQPWRRRLCSRTFRWFMIRIIKIPAHLTDSQCGFKVYRGDLARTLYQQCITNGFMFDVEIIKRAQKQGCQIKEFPIDWTCDRDSRLSLLQTSWRSLLELIVIKRALTKNKTFGNFLKFL